MSVNGDGKSVLGIDPGLKGGLAVLRDIGGRVIAADHMPMPVSDGEIDVGKIQDFVIRNRVTRAILEKQQVRGRQSGKGNFTIGANYGELRAVLKLCGLDFDEVRPKKWQDWSGVTETKVGKDTKTASINLCEAKGYPVPMTSNRSNASPHDGIADAWHIAAWGFYAEPS